MYPSKSIREPVASNAINNEIIILSVIELLVSGSIVNAPATFGVGVGWCVATVVAPATWGDPPAGGASGPFMNSPCGPPPPPPPPPPLGVGVGDDVGLGLGVRVGVDVALSKV